MHAKTRLLLALMLFSAPGVSWIVNSSLYAQANEIELVGPESAPIYVIDGEVSGSHSYRELILSYAWTSQTDPNMGTVSGLGTFSAIGGDINLAGSLSAKMFIKASGRVTRMGGKFSVLGAGTFGGHTVDRAVLNYSTPGLTVDPVSGRASGFVSAVGSLRSNTGKSSSARVATTFLHLDLPDANENGWDSHGDWKADFAYTVGARGKIVGTGNLSFLDESGDPFDVISQVVTGTLRSGLVTLNAAGSTRGISRIRANLTFRQSNNATLPGRSSVTAYGQSRKF